MELKCGDFEMERRPETVEYVLKTMQKIIASSDEESIRSLTTFD
jgi:hypothetical protein